MVFRSTSETDLARVLACAVTEPIGWVTADRYRAGLAVGQYRPEWTWIAEEGDRVLARALWWGRAGGDRPLALDCLHVHDSVADRAGLAAELLAAAHHGLRAQGIPRKPRYDLDLPKGWRDDGVASAAVAWRQEAAARAGLTEELERFRYVWTPDAGLPESTGRLTFTAESDDEVFLSALRRVAEGSLDVTTRTAIAVAGAELQARQDLDLYRAMPGRREWWRLAHTRDGRLAGLAMPNRNSDGPIVGYLGVVPELRGHHYIDDVLAEITRFHAEAGAQQITATTDVTNLPMAAAFERAGYRSKEVLLILSAPTG